jgi:hypothetical protein
LFIEVPVVNVDAEDLDVEVFVAAISAVVEGRRAEMMKGDSGEWRASLFINYYDILLSPSTYSGNISNPSSIASTFSHIARIDRLPPDNNLAGMYALRFAWDTIDVCNTVADQMKVVTKTTYTVLLVLGLTIGTITVVYLNDKELFSRNQLNSTTAALALISGVTAGFINTINPAQKWTRLRGAALAIEAEIYRFRTRTGDYAESDAANSSEDCAEQLLQQRSESIKTQALKSTGVLSTHFMSLFEHFNNPQQRSLFKHGQYENCSVRGSFPSASEVADVATKENAATLLTESKDDFHSPCRPDDYICHRVRKQLQFYQSRLPLYHRLKTTLQLLLVVGTFSSVVLALADASTWAALATALVGAITAFGEFQGTEEKLTRYSDSVSQIEAALMWWNMLPTVDQASVRKISELIDRCESVFRDERQAWVSLNIDKTAQNDKTKGEKALQEAVV